MSKILGKRSFELSRESQTLQVPTRRKTLKTKKSDETKEEKKEVVSNANLWRSASETFLQVKEFCSANILQAEAMMTIPTYKKKGFLNSALRSTVGCADLPKVKLLVVAGAEFLQQPTFIANRVPEPRDLSGRWRKLDTNQGLFVQALHSPSTTRGKVEIITYLLDQHTTTSTDGTDGDNASRVAIFDLHKRDPGPLVLAVRSLEDDLVRLLLDRGAIGIDEAMLKVVSFADRFDTTEDGEGGEDANYESRIQKMFNTLIYRGANHSNYESLIRSAPKFPIFRNSKWITLCRCNPRTCELWKALSQSLSVDEPSLASLFPDERDHHLPFAQIYLNHLRTIWRVGDIERFVDILRPELSAAAINWGSRQCDQVIRQEVLNSSTTWIPEVANIVCSFFVSLPVDTVA